MRRGKYSCEVFQIVSLYLTKFKFYGFTFINCYKKGPAMNFILYYHKNDQVKKWGKIMKLILYYMLCYIIATNMMDAISPKAAKHSKYLAEFLYQDFIMFPITVVIMLIFWILRETICSFYEKNMKE